MHAFLVTSFSKDLASEYVKKECQLKKISKFDIHLLTSEKQIGINDLRPIQKKIFLKPFSGNKKAVILDAYSGVTIEAQNSLLKILEEPPIDTIIYILALNKKLFLDTILSRCKIIEVGKNETSDQNKNQNLDDVLNQLTGSKVGDRLQLAQAIDSKKNTEEWLEQMIIFVRQKMIQDIEKHQYFYFLSSFQTTYRLIKSTNVNTRASLENLFLSF
jgi:DNA polymerase III subunit delta'